MGIQGAVISYKLEFWQLWTSLSGTTAKSRFRGKKQSECQVRSARACLPDWTRRAEDLGGMPSEPINELGKLARGSVASGVRHLCEHWNSSKAERLLKF